MGSSVRRRVRDSKFARNKFARAVRRDIKRTNRIMQILQFTVRAMAPETYVARGWNRFELREPTRQRLANQTPVAKYTFKTTELCRPCTTSYYDVVSCCTTAVWRAIRSPKGWRISIRGENYERGGGLRKYEPIHRFYLTVIFFVTFITWRKIDLSTKPRWPFDLFFRAISFPYLLNDFYSTFFLRVWCNTVEAYVTSVLMEKLF